VLASKRASERLGTELGVVLDSSGDRQGPLRRDLGARAQQACERDLVPEHDSLADESGPERQGVERHEVQ
jgi:hypothetical protein